MELDLSFAGWVLPFIDVITHVTDLWVLRLRLWDLPCWMLAVNSTVLSDGQELNHFNFEFVIHQIVVKNAAGRLSAVLLQARCLRVHSTEFPTCQETHRVNISRI